MGPVQTAIRRHLGRGDVLHTPSRRAEFVIGSIDSGGLVLLLGEGRHATPLSWEGLEGVIPFMASHGGSVRIGSLFDTRAIPGTLDEHLKKWVNRATAGWVAAVFEASGLCEIDRRRPARVRLVNR